jgi:hypothetical protein
MIIKIGRQSCASNFIIDHLDNIISVITEGRPESCPRRWRQNILEPETFFLQQGVTMSVGEL